MKFGCASCIYMSLLLHSKDVLFLVAADERYRGFARQSIFSYVRLMFTLTNYVKEIPLEHRPEYCFSFYDYLYPNLT